MDVCENPFSLGPKILQSVQHLHEGRARHFNEVVMSRGFSVGEPSGPGKLQLGDSSSSRPLSAPFHSPSSWYWGTQIFAHINYRHTRICAAATTRGTFYVLWISNFVHFFLHFVYLTQKYGHDCWVTEEQCKYARFQRYLNLTGAFQAYEFLEHYVGA